MNRQGPRVFIVSLSVWWLVWITKSASGREGANQHLAAEQESLMASPGSDGVFLCWLSSQLPLTQLCYPGHCSWA